MSDWKAKRFWSDVATVPEDEGFGIRLDDRPVRTPAKSPLVVPTLALAEAIAAEWAEQENEIDPLSMPFTRTANSAIDKVGTQKAEVADMLAAYGDSDLLCYRAEGPVSLVQRQSDAWDPLLTWAKDTLGVSLKTRVGVIHIPQDASELAKLSDQVHGLGNFALAAFHDLVSLSGSLIIGFAAAKKFQKAEVLWEFSRVDEVWQQEQWGEDEDALEVANRKKNAFLHAAKFLDFSN